MWLCQIAKNTYLSLLKKQKWSAPLEGDWPAPADLEERLGDKEDALKIHQVLHRLEELPGGLLAAGLWGAELCPDWRAV